MKKRFTALIIAVFIILFISRLPEAGALTSDYVDITGHWAEDVIDKWTGFGVLKGYGDEYRPNNYITRGELAIMVSRIMNYTTVSTEVFRDLNTCPAEHKTAILKLNAAGAMLGSNGYMRPNDYITREEACVIIGRAMMVEPSATSTVAFIDDASISDWSHSMVMGMTSQGYLAGRGDGYFVPKENMTRSEVIKAIDNIILSGYFYAKGSYPISYLGNAVINTAGIELKQATITGDLIITEGVGSGTVTLTDVTVMGNMYVFGGKTVVMNGNTKIANYRSMGGVAGVTTYKSEHSAILETLTIEPGSAPLAFEGSVRNLVINAPNYTLNLKNTMVVNLEVNSYEVTINMDKTSVVSSALVNETLKVLGEGRITDVVLRPGSNGSSFETQPQRVSIPSYLTVFLAGNAYYNNTGASATYVYPIDSVVPQINDYALTVTKIGPDSIALSWKTASDNVTVQKSLRYLLFYSTDRHMNSVEDIESYGYPTMPYTAGALAGTALRLKVATTYYFNVIVMDEAGNKSCYEQISLEIENDQEAPVIRNRSLSVSGVKQNQITLGWTRASDDVTPEENLIYTVYQSDSANLNTALGCEENGKQVMKPTANVVRTPITGLKENHVYYFNVVVTDEAGNKECYSQVSAVPVKDVLPPSVGLGRITPSNQSENGVLLVWDAAADASTESEKLKYALYTSSSDNISTVDEIKSNGKVVKSATVNYLSHALTNQKSGIYYYNVLVTDEAGNTACYPSIRLVFGEDTTAPKPPSPSTLTLMNVTNDSAVISWKTADDLAGGIVGSSADKLTYTLYRGKPSVTANNGSNFRTVDNIVANSDWNSGLPVNILELEATGLLANTTYYFNVIVHDEKGFTSCYTPLKVIVDATPPNTPLQNYLTITGNQINPSFTITWSAANDGQGTIPGNLVYTLYYSGRDLTGAFSDMDTKIESVISGGTVLKSAKSFTSHTYSGAHFDEMYYFYLIVSDEAGNKTLYDAFNNTTNLPFVLADTTAPWPSGSITAVTTSKTPNPAGGYTVSFTFPKMSDNRVSSSQIIYYMFYGTAPHQLYTGNDPEEVFRMYRDGELSDYLGSMGQGIRGLSSIESHAIRETTHYYILFNDGYNNYSMLYGSTVTVP